ncbi:MAG: 4-hydroxy-tetrahydrodipicolinate synthase [Gammaproteobacteria bacterium]|nr:4-hydroxy-tetrahydrodipicolinate synthase [Gammaproteobacteria bacterium]
MFRGSLVALVTPMQPDGAVDYAALEYLINWHCEQGTQGIVAVGTTGESATLDFDEHTEVIRRVVQMVNGRVPVIAGTGANATSEAIYMTQQAQSVGADACLLVTPYYNKPTQEGLFLHHQAIAAAVDIPQILYNVPGRTAVDMKAATVARLSKISNIIGIKEAMGDIPRIREIRELCGKEFAIYSGDDATAVEAMLAGADGVISVTNNIAPAAMRQVCDAALAGDADSAMMLDKKLQGLHQDLFIEANPIPVKWALNEMGLIKTGIRLPMTWLSESCRSRVRAALQQAEIL